MALGRPRFSSLGGPELPLHKSDLIDISVSAGASTPRLLFVNSDKACAFHTLQVVVEEAFGTVVDCAVKIGTRSDDDAFGLYTFSTSEAVGVKNITLLDRDVPAGTEVVVIYVDDAIAGQCRVVARIGVPDQEA